MTGSPSSAQELPKQTPNTSAPIAQVTDLAPEGLFDSLGKPITGTLQAFVAYVTPSWRYLLGTFVQKSSSVDPNYSATAGGAYSQSVMQGLIDQVAALSAQVGKS